jgi:ABC-2 type transport system ATP-binding protein
MAGIQIKNLVKTYARGKVRALDGVSLTIPPGQVFGVIGPNGAGKTTLMGCLLGFLNPDSGSIEIDGLDPNDLRARAVTGYVPERLAFDRWMNGREFVTYHHALAKLPAARRDGEVVQALSRVGLEEDAWTRPIAKYSRGMLQRLGLAQALLGSPRYLFLDEPTSGMDPLGVMAVRELLSEIKKQGSTILLNSHQLDQVDRICDNVAFVKNGRVESMETMNAGAESQRAMAITWRKLGKGSAVAAAKLKQIAEKCGGELLESAEGKAEFLVKDDEGAEKLLALLVRAGIPVIEASSAEKRLERLFLGEKRGKDKA